VCVCVCCDELKEKWKENERLHIERRKYFNSNAGLGFRVTEQISYCIRDGSINQIVYVFI